MKPHLSTLTALTVTAFALVSFAVEADEACVDQRTASPQSSAPKPDLQASAPALPREPDILCACVRLRTQA